MSPLTVGLVSTSSPHHYIQKQHGFMVVPSFAVLAESQGKVSSSCPKRATHTEKEETKNISTLDLHTQRSWERGRGG